MTAPFALDAFEKYLRLAAATGDALEWRPISARAAQSS